MFWDWPWMRVVNFGAFILSFRLTVWWSYVWTLVWSVYGSPHDRLCRQLIRIQAHEEKNARNQAEIIFSPIIRASERQLANLNFCLRHGSPENLQEHPKAKYLNAWSKIAKKKKVCRIGVISSIVTQSMSIDCSLLSNSFCSVVFRVTDASSRLI